MSFSGVMKIKSKNSTTLLDNSGSSITSTQLLSYLINNISNSFISLTFKPICKTECNVYDLF